MSSPKIQRATAKANAHCHDRPKGRGQMEGRFQKGPEGITDGVGEAGGELSRMNELCTGGWCQVPPGT